MPLLMVLPNVPPPDSSPLVPPTLGDIWEYADAGNPFTPKGERIRITFVGGDGSIAAETLLTGRPRAWTKHELFWAAWKLVIPAAQAPAPADLSRFPHVCPRCQRPAYLGGGPSNVDCSNELCSTKDRTMKLPVIHEIGMVNS